MRVINIYICQFEGVDIINTCMYRSPISRSNESILNFADVALVSDPLL